MTPLKHQEKNGNQTGQRTLSSRSSAAQPECSFSSSCCWYWRSSSFSACEAQHAWQTLPDYPSKAFWWAARSTCWTCAGIASTANSSPVQRAVRDGPLHNLGLDRQPVLPTSPSTAPAASPRLMHPNTHSFMQKFHAETLCRDSLQQFRAETKAPPHLLEQLWLGGWVQVAGGR
jgi:hypothetical protein